MYGRGFGALGMLLGALGATIASGCVSVATKTTYSEEPVRRRSKVSTIADSKHYFAKSKLEGEMLALTVGSEHQCRVAVTPIFHKYARHERTVADTARGSTMQPRYTALYGLTFSALGAYSCLDADSLASTSTSGSTPGDYRSGGITLIGVGAALLAIAAIDQIRLQDSSEDLGEVEHEPEVREEACKRKPADGEKVIVRNRSALRKSGSSRSVVNS